MPGAQAARLRDALQDYISAYQGDGSSGMRSAQTGGEAVSKAKALLSALDGGDSDKADSPGRRSAKAAGLGDDGGSNRQRVRDMLARQGK